ncbi:MAG: helix-turn-helix transcriptional regulator [Anaerolineales bacterium]|nr:helix-turn-helix transcriptional regulator [Anaerolineales bacterium]
MYNHGKMNARLTVREFEILRCFDQTNRQTAEKLSISENSVRTHWQHIRCKLGVRTRQQAAEALGLIPPSGDEGEVALLGLIGAIRARIARCADRLPASADLDQLLDEALTRLMVELPAPDITRDCRGPSPPAG